jgi:septation ring formation regulator EzrA
VAVRELLNLPGLPGRVEHDLDEIKQLVRALLGTEETLVQTTRATNDQAKQLDTAVRQLAEALDHFRSMNTTLAHVDRRLEVMERDIRGIANAIGDVVEHLPSKQAGPIEKARDALTGGS